jgi:beta-galactosidase
MVAYWHWHTLHYGNESYWGGVLHHDLEPGRTYAEVQRIARELREHDSILTDLRPDADAAFLYSQDSKYALEFMPALAQPGSNLPDRASYQRIFDTFYRGFFDARVQTIILNTEQNFEEYPVLVVPSLYIADSLLLERLVEYALNGGHLLLTFKSGYADQFARIQWQRAPGVLRKVVGASYQEYSNLPTPLSLKLDGNNFALPPDAQALGWADGLHLEGAAPLAYYDHPHFGRFPAIVSQSFGKGRVTYCGTLPNASLGRSLAQWVMEQVSVQPGFSNLPLPVRATSATARNGSKLWFFTNWSYEIQQIERMPFSGYELFSNATVPEGSRLILEPWDIKIIT